MNTLIKNTIILIGSIALIIIGINAFAHSGYGGGGGHHGSGWHHHDGYYPGYSDDMSPEAYEQFEQKRDAFFKETQEIRNELYAKNRELENELAKPEPDAAEASRLQKEISDLRSQFDQKRIEHMVEMKKLNPNAGPGYMHGYHMKGERSYRGGYCWQ